MSQKPSPEYLSEVGATIDHALEVAEMWTGTQYEEIIRDQVSVLEKALDRNDLEEVDSQMTKIKYVLNQAEEAYDER